MKEHYTIAENEDLITKFEYIMNMQGYYGVADINLIYKSLSLNTAKLLGWNKPENAINESANRIPSRAVEQISLYRKYLDTTVKLKQKVGAIHIQFIQIQGLYCSTRYISY